MTSRTRVFVGHLDQETRTRDLEKFFKDYGFSKIRDINLKGGFAFVDFEDERDASDAVYELNHKELIGSRITLEHAKVNRNENHRGRGFERGGSGGGRDSRDGGGYRGGRDSGGGGGGGYRKESSRYGAPYNTEFRIIIENLSTRAGWQDIKDFFRQAGEVTFAKCHREKVGQGVVEFASSRDLKAAMRKLDGKELMGKRLKLIDDSGQGGHGSRSRSLSRSRSPRRRSYSRSRSRSRTRSRTPEDRDRT